MGLISFVKDFKLKGRKSVVVVDIGGGNLGTQDHFSDCGDDSTPLPTDYCASMEVQASGGHAAVGYIDGKNLKKANAGEKRIYARDADGNIVCEIWLKGDATIEINGATVTADGDFITRNGISLDNHIHAQGNDSLGGAQVPTDKPMVA